MKGEFLNEQELKGRHSEEKQELHRQINQAEAALRQYRAEHGKLEVFFDRVTSCITPIEPFPSVFKKIYNSAGKSSNTEIVPVMHDTDAHMGAVQEAIEIEHFGAFNPDLCDKRVIGFTQGFIDWCQLHRGPYNIKKLHILFTGDLISGDIHDELRVTNAFPVTEQVVRAAQLYAKQIAIVAPYFEEVTVEFLTEDNHSRLTKKPQAKEAGINSYGYLIAKMIEAYIAKIENVRFNIHAMHEKVVRVSTRNYLITHMHGVRAWMGIPWYGIERRTAREATARQNIIMSDLSRANEVGFHKIIHGHFHTAFDTPLYSGGGSVSGTDAYDHSAGRYSRPSQSAWMVHPKWGEFNRINFQLERYDND